MKLIGLSGAAGAGKDTVAGLVLEHVPGHAVAFADPLRRAAAEAFGLSMHQMLDRELKEQVVPHWGKSPREILQLLGTECFRDVFGGDHWCRRAEITLAEIIEQDARVAFAADVCLFTDVRFVDEVQWIKSHGGIVVEVRRSEVYPVGVVGHRSAQPLPAELVDWVVYNEESLAVLAQRVPLWLSGWLSEATPLHEAKKQAA